MAWEKIKITANDKEVEGYKKGNIIEMPFVEDINPESTISVDGNTIQVTMVTDIGDRNETLKLEVKEDGKQVSRRTRSKSKSEEIQD